MTSQFMTHISRVDNEARHADLSDVDYWAYLKKKGIEEYDMDRFAEEMQDRETELAD